jgi:hypothetical protein
VEGRVRNIHTADARRSQRLQNVGEAIRLYEQLERALGQTVDADLERLASASRAGERAFGSWAQRIEAFRILKRRFEGGSLPQVPISSAPLTNGRGWHPTKLSDLKQLARIPRLPRMPMVEDPPKVPFMWETVAFALGLIWSLLFT